MMPIDKRRVLSQIYQRSWCDGSSDQSFMVDPLSYFSFQPGLWDGAHKRSLAANRHVVAAADFLSRYLNGPLPYNAI